MKLTSFAAAALALALLAPVSASAGQVWTDGNYYSACPDELEVLREGINVIPRNEWTNLMGVNSTYGFKFERAWVDTNLRKMFCSYEKINHLMVEPFPAGYSTCVAYSGIWFKCTK